MKRLLTPQRREQLHRITGQIGGLWSRQNAFINKQLDRISVPQGLRRHFEKPKPEHVITPRKQNILAVVIGGTTVLDYELAGQFGRLTTALERFSRQFDSVMLVTGDRSSYSDRIGLPNVSHIRSPLPLPFSKPMRTAFAVLTRFKTVRRATAVLALDEPGALAGSDIARLSGSKLALELGAPWSPPQMPGTLARRRSRFFWNAARKIDLIVTWRDIEEMPECERATVRRMKQVIDSDLYCPVTTTDPYGPRLVMALLPAADVAGAQVLMGVADRLKRLPLKIELKAFVLSRVTGETRATGLQGEAVERQAAVDFAPLPQSEMLPDLLARPRMCIVFRPGKYADSLKYQLRAMASGVPCVYVQEQESGTGDKADWRRFALPARESEADITKIVEALLREPVTRTRLGREGRRFVKAMHSLEAIQAEEAELLKSGQFTGVSSDTPDEYDTATEAEKLTPLLDSLADMSDEEAPESEPEEVAA